MFEWEKIPIFWIFLSRQHFDQHQLLALGTNMLAKEKTKEKCWPTFLKKLRNVDQQIRKNGINWHVGAACGASQDVSQHGIWIRMFFYDSNVKIVESRIVFYSKWMDIYTCWSDKRVFKANRTNTLTGLCRP